MPIFMDTHEGADLPDDVRRAVESRVKSGEKDRFGVVDKGIIIDREARRMHCILDAPDVDAIKRHHEAFNVEVPEHTIHRADVILR